MTRPVIEPGSPGLLGEHSTHKTNEPVNIIDMAYILKLGLCRHSDNFHKAV